MRTYLISHMCLAIFTGNVHRCINQSRTFMEYRDKRIVLWMKAPFTIIKCFVDEMRDHLPMVSVYQGLLHFRPESIIFHNTNITILYMIVCNQLPKMSWPSHASRYSDALIMKNITLYANTVIWLCNWYHTLIVSCSIFRYINSSSRYIFYPSMWP